VLESSIGRRGQINPGLARMEILIISTRGREVSIWQTALAAGGGQRQFVMQACEL